jgi:hypothetical protein
MRTEDRQVTFLVNGRRWVVLISDTAAERFMP